MSIILESDILNAYINNEINEYDVIDLYSEGYISDNTMELLISEDECISEAVTDYMGEGVLERGINNIKAAFTKDDHKKADLYYKNHLDALGHGRNKAAKKYLNKFEKIKYGTDGKKYYDELQKEKSKTLGQHAKEKIKKFFGSKK